MYVCLCGGVWTRFVSRVMVAHPRIPTLPWGVGRILFLCFLYKLQLPTRSKKNKILVLKKKKRNPCALLNTFFLFNPLSIYFLFFWFVRSSCVFFFFFGPTIPDSTSTGTERQTKRRARASRALRLTSTLKALSATRKVYCWKRCPSCRASGVRSTPPR